MAQSDKKQGPYIPPVIYDAKRGGFIDSTDGHRLTAAELADYRKSNPPAMPRTEPWDHAPRTDAMWQRHTEDAATLEDRHDLRHYYEMATHACQLERELRKLSAEYADLKVYGRSAPSAGGKPENVDTAELVYRMQQALQGGWASNPGWQDVVALFKEAINALAFAPSHERDIPGMKRVLIEDMPALKASELDVYSALFGLRFVPGCSNGCVELYVEDDDFWHYKLRFDRSWLKDLADVAGKGCAPSATPCSEDAACKVAADLLRGEIVRLEKPKAMFPQEAEKIGRRQTAFQEAVRYLDPPERPKC